jgi:hypothetical protein
MDFGCGRLSTDHPGVRGSVLDWEVVPSIPGTVALARRILSHIVRAEERGKLFFRLMQQAANTPPITSDAMVERSKSLRSHTQAIGAKPKRTASRSP